MGTIIIDAIKSGLALVSELASAMNSGFNALFVDSTGNTIALTNVGQFAFILLGLGIAVGLAKLLFQWVTGRHGM